VIQGPYPKLKQNFFHHERFHQTDFTTLTWPKGSYTEEWLGEKNDIKIYSNLSQSKLTRLNTTTTPDQTIRSENRLPKKYRVITTKLLLIKKKLITINMTAKPTNPTSNNPLLQTVKPLNFASLLKCLALSGNFCLYFAQASPWAQSTGSKWCLFSNSFNQLWSAS
jgi:hypothetical protein